MRPLSLRPSLVVLSLAALSLCAPAAGQRVVLEYADPNVGVQREENARRWEFERMGYYTNAYWSNYDQGWFNTYGATRLGDVWYVPHTIDPAVLGEKMRLYQRGVIYEGAALDAEFGLADGDGDISTGGAIDTLTAHPVTANVPAGSVAIWASGQPISKNANVIAPGATTVAEYDGEAALLTIEAGGALANTLRSNSVATGKRVRLPVGAGSDWNQATDSLRQVLEDSVEWAADYTPALTGLTAVLVVDENGVLNAQEKWRLRRLRYFGYAVVLLWDGDSQASYDAALAAADVVWVAATCDPTDVGYKLRQSPIGVVTELAELDDEMGYSTSAGFYSNASWIYILDRTHPVTAAYPNAGPAYGYTVFWRYNYSTNNWDGNNQPLSRLQGTAAAGLRVLGTQWGSTTLAIVEAGGTLANSYSGNNTAAGRRVRLPWGGNSLDTRGVLSWTDATSMLYNALRWASGPSSGTLIAHYKLDETSGTTATDSSPSAFHGAYEGSPTLGIAPAPRGLAANFDANGEAVYVTAKPQLAALNGPNADFSIAFWMRPRAQTHTDWRNLLHLGGANANDRGPLIMLHPNRRVHAWCSTDAIPTGEGRWTSAEFEPDKWAHLTLVKTGQQMRWYVNGVYDGGHVLSGQTITSAGQLRIGRKEWWGRPDADLDDVRVYDYGLSDQEIVELHADLVLHYKLDETSGTVAKDSSVFKIDAALNTGTASWTTGAVDGAATFDGSTDFLGSKSFDPPGAGTVAFWMRPGALPPSFARPFGLGDEFEIRQNSDGTVAFDVGIAGFNSAVATTTALSDAQRWYHCAVSFDASNDSYKVYLDGVLHTSGTSPIDIVDPAPAVMSVGTRTGSSDRYTGRLDDIRIYRRVLTDQEVYELGGNGLQLHLKLDETSGTVAKDSSPYGNNGTYKNGVALGPEAIHATGAAFDGVDDYIAVPINVSETAYSSAFWFKTTQANCGLYAITNAEPGDGHIDRHLWLANGQVRVRTWSDETITGSATNLNDGRWHHVAHTVGVGGQKLYVDGRLVASGTKASSDYNWQTRVIVGCAFTSETPNRYFDGQIDDVRVYSKVLTPEEVAELHGLVGHWRMNEYAGDTVAVDETVFSNDGEYVNTPALEQEGPYPSAAVATGVRFAPTQRAEVPHGDHLELGYDNADFSVAFWLKNNRDYDGQWRETFKKHHDGTRRTPAMWLHPSNNRMHVRISTTYSWNEGTDDTVAEFDPGVWRHVAYVKEGSKLSIYVDGVLDRSRTLTGTVVGNNGRLYWGAIHGSQKSDVTMDDVRVYQRALRDWEIAELYGLVGRWKLDEVSGASVATDSTGMKRHGTYVGSPLLGQAGPEDATLAATFDGIDDWVQLPTYRESFADGVAIAAWARPTEDRVNAAILHLHTGGEKISLSRNGDGAGLRGRTKSDGTGTLLVGRGLQNDVWRHYAMSVDSGGTMSLYRDGVLLGSQSVAMPAVVERSNNFIGWNSSSATAEPFQGDLHDVRLYNRPISKAEARGLYLGEQVPGLRIVKWVEAPNP